MHLLVVEDDPKLGRLLVRMLGDERHLVELTASGHEALEIAEAGSGIDAMILDIGLPDLPGTDVARRLRVPVESSVVVVLGLALGSGLAARTLAAPQVVSIPAMARPASAAFTRDRDRDRGGVSATGAR
ncbi:MAG TPA: response regulator [Candidatus Limnocylindria bacterium]|jgi:CheY-like chemotaxis protein